MPSAGEDSEPLGRSVASRDAELVRPLWETVWQFLSKVKGLSHDAVILSLGYFTQKKATLCSHQVFSPDGPQSSIYSS